MVSAWKDSTYYLSASGPALQSPASSVPGHSCVDKKIWGSFPAEVGKGVPGLPMAPLLPACSRVETLLNLSQTSEHPLVGPCSSPPK